MANFKLFHNNPNIRTIGDFVESYKIRIDDEFTVTDFFNKNRNNIFKQISPSQLIELANEKQKTIESLTASDIDENFVLPCPCYLFIDDKYVDYVLATKHTNFQVQEFDFISFANKEIKRLIQEQSELDKEYSYSLRKKVGCRVIGWFKTLYYSSELVYKNSDDINDIYSTSSNFVDLSPFISQLRTSVNGSGGSFSLSLCAEPLTNFSSGSLIGWTSMTPADKIFEKIKLDEYSHDNGISFRHNFDNFNYFEYLIQHNDLLFIAFDDLPDLIDDNLSGHSFDMIALVDNISVNKNASSASITITVTGRDLMKLITDDASIFFPAGTSASDGRIFDNTEATLRGGDLFSTRENGRMRSNGIRQPSKALDVFIQEPNGYTIDFVIKAVVSQLANMQIVPDYLFASWGDKRTKFSDLISQKIEKK